MKATCKHCGIDEPDHVHDCVVSLRRRDSVAHALVMAYRDARRAGVEARASFWVRGVFRELDALYPRAPWDPPPEDPRDPREEP